MTDELWFWIVVIALAYGAAAEFFAQWHEERNSDDVPDWRDEL